MTKEECVNHMSKRLRTALRKVAAEGCQENVVTGGKGFGELTSNAIMQLQKYYGRAIRSHPDDLEVPASFLHVLSIDEVPYHDCCPAGASSWCFFCRAVAKGEAGAAIAVSEFYQGGGQRRENNCTRVST